MIRNGVASKLRVEVRVATVLRRKFEMMSYNEPRIEEPDGDQAATVPSIDELHALVPYDAALAAQRRVAYARAHEDPGAYYTEHEEMQILTVVSATQQALSADQIDTQIIKRGFEVLETVRLETDDLVARASRDVIALAATSSSGECHKMCTQLYQQLSAEGGAALTCAFQEMPSGHITQRCDGAHQRDVDDGARPVARDRRQPRTRRRHFPRMRCDELRGASASPDC